MTLAQSTHNENDTVLLPKDVDCLITRNDYSYSDLLNITYRSPRKIGGSISSLVSVTTLKADELNGLRVEELDGQIFIVSDQKGSRDGVKICVMSADIGYKIIKEILKKTETKRTDASIEDSVLPKKYKVVNSTLIEFLPTISIACGVLLSLTASILMLSNA